MITDGVVIIGASHGGVQAAQSLRQAGYDQPITLISDDTFFPYHRPPLSKSYLVDPVAGMVALKAESFFLTNNIELRLGTCATQIDRCAKTVRVGNEVVPYDLLILATGAVARRLPDTDFHNVHYLRDVADADRLNAGLIDAKNLVVIGGGFIGLEVAATALKLGKSVTILETQSRLLARSMPPRVANHIAARHEAEGCRILYGINIASIEGTRGIANNVNLECGTRLPADLILVGIGSVPNTELAEAAGLELFSGGVLVDEHLRSSDPAIYAIGDCATFASAFSNSPIRLESVQNATDQAKAVATHIMGDTTPYHSVPWFWTEQFDMRIKMAGLPCEDAEELLRGDPSSGAFSLLLVKDGFLRAAYSINAPADHIAARKLIGSDQRIDTAKASVFEQPLKTCLLEEPTSARK